MDKDKENILAECRTMIKEIGRDMEEMMAEIDKLRKENDELRRKNAKLLKMVMKTEDAIALPDVHHRAFFGIMEILSMDIDSAGDKLDNLKIYLRPCIEENPRIVLSIVSSIKEEHEEYSSILKDFHEWILNSFAY